MKSVCKNCTHEHKEHGEKPCEYCDGSLYETKKLDDEYLEEIRERANSATKGPWKLNDSIISEGHEVWGPASKSGTMLLANFGYAAFDGVNAKFCAHARTDIPKLLDYIDKLKTGLKCANHGVACSAQQNCDCYECRLYRGEQ